MKYTGRQFTYDHSENRLLDVILTESQLSADYLQDGKRGSLVAASIDGVCYRGTYGVSAPHPDNHFETRLFRCANGEVLLFGRWWEIGGEKGTNLMHLFPDKSQE